MVEVAGFETEDTGPDWRFTAWHVVGIGLAGSFVLAVLTLMLVLRFADARPLDLRDLSLETSEMVHDLLRTAQVPPRNISSTAPALYRSGEAYYYFFDYEAFLPHTTEMSGVVGLIERDVLGKGLSIATRQEVGGTTVMEVAIGEYSIGTIRLLSGVIPRMADDRSARRRAASNETDRGRRNVAEASTYPVSTPPAPVIDAPGPIAVVAAAAKMPSQPGWRPPVPVEEAESDSTTKVAQAPARLAIIVDDGGYGGAVTDAILSLDSSLTLSILPNTPFGRGLATQASNLGFEIMLHMPMENTSETLRHEGQLEMGMAEDEIVRLTREALGQVPGAVGVNNHTGSKFTIHPRGLSLFMTTVANEGLFFVDSLTASGSRAYDVATAFGVPSASRDIFLDHDNSIEMIRRRFRQLVDLAKARGTALGICHFRPNTAMVLEEMLPVLAAEGVELVPASELVR